MRASEDDDRFRATGLEAPGKIERPVVHAGSAGEAQHLGPILFHIGERVGALDVYEDAAFMAFTLQIGANGHDAEVFGQQVLY